VVRVPGYTFRVGLERGPLSLVSTSEELLERKNSGSDLEIREYGRWDPSRHVAPSIRKMLYTNFADSRWSLGWYISLAGSGHGVCFVCYKLNPAIFQNIALISPYMGYIPEYGSIHNFCCENPKSYLVYKLTENSGRTNGCSFLAHNSLQAPARPSGN
jgi:hypothetical protein